MKILTIILGLLTATGIAHAADEKKAAYPLTVCVVSGEKLDSMGGPFVKEYKGQEVRFCCEHCLPKFEKSPETYLEKLKAATK